MEKKLDLRVQKTYKALCSTFIIMLEEMRFDDITVNELCERSMVRRATFYKHFADKYDFFGFFIRYIQDDIENQITIPNTAPPQTYYIYVLKKGISFLKQHEKIVKGVLKSSMLLTLLDILSEEIYKKIYAKLCIDIERGVLYHISPEVLASFYTGGMVHTLRWWLEDSNKISEEELVKEIEKIIFSFQPTL